MSERANIKVDRETYEKHNERRQALGLTWAGYLDAQAPPAIDDEDVRELLDELASLRERVDALEGELDRRDG